MTDKTQAERNAAAARAVGLEISESIIEFDVCHVAMTGPLFDGLPRIECPSRVFDPINNAADFAELLERVYAMGYEVRFFHDPCSVELWHKADQGIAPNGSEPSAWAEGPTMRHALVDAVAALGEAG